MIRFLELTKNLQFNLAPKRLQGYHAKFVRAFHLSRRVFYFHLFFKITNSCVRRSFSMCSRDLIFGTNKSRILKNGSCFFWRWIDADLLSPQKRKNMRPHLSATVELKNSLAYMLVSEHSATTYRYPFSG